MAGRFNKILEFIGLVDDEQDEELDQGRRPISGQTYGAQNRRPSAQSAPRYNSYEEPRSRVTSSRPDYDARSRRDAAGAPRYGADYRAAAPRNDYASQGGYQAPQGGYAGGYGQRDYSYGQQRPQRDPFEESFDNSQQRANPRGGRERDNRAAQPQGNVVPMRPAEPARQSGSQAVIYYLHQLGECRDVINDLLDGKTVLLNLEDMDERVMQRGIDTLCGAAFALGATLRKTSDKTYLIAPRGVEVASTSEAQNDRY